MTYRYRTTFHLANLSTFLLSTSTAFFLLFPIFLKQIGATTAEIGLVAGIFRASSLIGRPLAGWQVDRRGRRPVILAGVVLVIIAWLSLFPFPRLGVLFVAMRVLHGVGVALYDSGLTTLMADLSPPAHRAQVFAVYTVWITLPNALMPAAGEFVMRRWGFYPLFVLAAVVAGLALAIVLGFPETIRDTHERGKLDRGGVRAGTTLFLASALLGGAYGTLATFVPVARIAAAPGRVGLFFFSYFTGLIAIRLAEGLGAERLVSPRLLFPAFGTLVAGLGALSVLTSPVILAIVGLVCGASHGIMFPLLYALMVVASPREERGRMLSLLAAAFDLGMVISSFGFGALGEFLGYRGIFGSAAVAVALGAGAVAWLGRR